MDEKIVIPLDGSKVGEAALPYVKDIISKMSPEVKVEVVLLHVLRMMAQTTIAGELAAVGIPYTEQQTEERRAQATDYLDRAGEILKSKGVTVTAKVAFGEAPQEIVKAAEEVNANLIAMSTHGRSGLGRWAFGSVTDRVLRMEGHIPIIMVRAPKSKA